MKYINQIKDMDSASYNFCENLIKNMPKHLREKCRFKSIKTNQCLMQANEKSEFVYILIEGVLKVVEHHESGDVYTIAEFIAPKFIGEIEAFSNYPYYKGTVIATQNCTLVEVPVKVFLEWLKNDSNLLFERTTAISKHFSQQISEERKFFSLQGIDRLTLFLSNYYTKYQKNDQVQITSTNEQISSEIGCSLKTVNRAIIKLKEQNLVNFNGKNKSISKKQFQKLQNLIDQKFDIQ